MGKNHKKKTYFADFMKVPAVNELLAPLIYDSYHD